MGQSQSNQESEQERSNNLHDDTTDNTNNNNNSSSNSSLSDNSSTRHTRDRVARPSARFEIERNNPISRSSTPSSLNQRQREERRWRRLSGRDNDSEDRTNHNIDNDHNEINTLADALNNAREESHQSDTGNSNSQNISPFSRMIVQVISEAVVSSFQNGQLPIMNTDSNTQERINSRQRLTMHLSPEIFQQMEPGNAENSFMRFMRLPVILSTAFIAPTEPTEDAPETSAPATSDLPASDVPETMDEDVMNTETDNNSTVPIETDAETNEDITMASPSDAPMASSAVSITHSNESIASDTTNSPTSSVMDTDQPSHPPTTASNETTADDSTSTRNERSDISRLLMLPVFLYGLRSNNTTTTNQHTTSDTHHDTTSEDANRNETMIPPIRRSERIRERLEREMHQDERSTESNTRQSPLSEMGQWTVYIISGSYVENYLVSENPSYEELLALATLIGPARRSTVSQEAIDSHVPIMKYTQQVKQMILGNSEGCQVCLSNYQSEDDLRILSCHHGFHKECIDKWLTEGQNRCPLCRNEPVPTRDH
ncbi:hypothetical protein BDB01DRAFT_782027 [Pilobolus umbonatus]|nr:hypothetical protein BDB01DRAFT_782027 [Pilobolus umbonatus]